MKKNKIPTDLIVMLLISGTACILGVLSFLGVWDGFPFPEDLVMLIGMLFMAGLGLINTLILLIPMWIVYGYVKAAIWLYRKKQMFPFILWLILIPLFCAIIAGGIFFLYWLTHQPCY